ncbi:MAG: MmcQ/YjbR family DNA-binding protein [Vicinamibacterales bacterium]
MTADDFRRIALGLDGAIESAHMGHPDFRVNGRIFATLRADQSTGMVKVSPAEQAALVRDYARTFMPSSGAWGRAGCTDVRLETAAIATVRGALILAWTAATSRPPATRRAKRAAPARNRRGR